MVMRKFDYHRSRMIAIEIINDNPPDSKTENTNIKINNNGLL
jgi:hypothetical protein